MQPLVMRILDQTRARLLGGDTHVPDKVLSVFEPHTEAIRKGKIAKPTEFGKLVTIQEAEHQIITAYEVHATRPADMTLWTPALDRHIAIFGRPPDLAAGDRGFASAEERRGGAGRAVCDASSCPGRAENAGAARPRAAAVVSARPTVARRLRRPDQCAQTSTWTAPLSLSGRRWHGPLGRARRHRE